MERERNPNANKFITPNTYKDLGYLFSNNNEAIVSCRSQKHHTKEFDNSLYKNRCTDVITICDECKYIYHTDMSD